MVSNGGGWVRVFDIPDVSKHKRGFTIYKIISLLYPETCPDAVTKLTVWKRYNDIKRLHREMKVLHKKLNIRDKYYILPRTSFFKRFDEETVQERRQNILSFLEYIGSHSQLFTSQEFVGFFESSHTPIDQLSSCISSIRSDLNLPEDPEYLGGNSDDEPTISDTESVSTLNSAYSNDFLHESLSHKSLSKSKSSLNRKNSDSMSASTTTDSMILIDGQVFPTPPSTPMWDENYVQYIIDASVHINMAVELENERKYEEAFIAYKTAIDILLKYGKDDKNYDRRQLAKYKTEKYLIRAEKIYNMHLAAEVKNLRDITNNDDCGSKEEHFVQRPISELYKYKVVRIVPPGMLVLHSEIQQLFYIKVIHKTMTFLSDHLILPENVPYMVKLYNYYNCENAFFLILEYCSGKRLLDYIKFRSENPDDVFYQYDDQMLRQTQDLDLSDPESEHSYSELINDYTSNKSRTNPSLSSDGSYEKVALDDDHSSRNLMDEPIPSLPTSSMSLEIKTEKHESSDMSSFEEVDTNQNSAIPMQEIVKWTAQLLLAIEKLHALGVICRDLQSHNILINDEGDLVLTYMCNVNELCDVFCNEKSPHLAPEVYSFQAVTEAVDWWSLGVILYELLVGMPLSSLHPDGLHSSTHLKIPKYVSAEGRSLLKQLLTFYPHERLGFGPNGIENLKSHPFFNAVSWTSLLAKCNC